VPKVTASVTFQPRTGRSPTGDQEPSVPWPALLVSLATTFLAAAMGLRTYGVELGLKRLRGWERSLSRLRPTAGR